MVLCGVTEMVTGTFYELPPRPRWSRVHFTNYHRDRDGHGYILRTTTATKMVTGTFYGATEAVSRTLFYSLLGCSNPK